VTTQLGIRAERKRLTTRELILAGFDLFARQGYDDTTVEQIAEQVGISKRTFFRYFANKQDLVLGDLDHTAALLVLTLKERPPSEHSWLALRRSFDFFVDACTNEKRRVSNAMRIMESSVELKAAQLGKLEIWRGAIVPVLADRLDITDDLRQMHAAALAGAALTCLDAALNAWYIDFENQNLAPLLDSAMEAVAPLQ